MLTVIVPTSWHWVRGKGRGGGGLTKLKLFYHTLVGCRGVGSSFTIVSTLTEISCVDSDHPDL